MTMNPSSEPSSSKLSRRLLTGNVMWSLAGTGLPLLVGLWAIPLLIEGLGKERFGLLTIIWMGIGYFSFFDLGIGRALTKLVAEGIATQQITKTANLIFIGLRLMMTLGLMAGLLVASSSPYLIDHILSVPPELRQEAIGSLWILAATLPFVISSAGLIGILQAHQRFSIITKVRVPLGVLNFAGPLLVLPFSHSLIYTTAVMAVGRILSWLVYWQVCREYGRNRTELDRPAIKLHLRHLLGFGGWITVSNIVSPMMVYFDRFFVGALIGLSAVAYYATPYEIISRISLIPIAIADVMFPAFAMALASDGLQAKPLFIGAAIVLMGVLLPAIGFIILFAPEGLQWWLGAEFSLHSTAVLRWLALGVFINSFARLPLALLQAHQRPDITAKIHLAELPLYVATVYFLTLQLGITGTAMAWTLRVSTDALLLFFFSAKTLPSLRTAQIQAVSCIGLMVLLLGGLLKLNLLNHKILAFGFLLLVSMALLWVGFSRRGSKANPSVSDVSIEQNLRPLPGATNHDHA